MQWESNAVFITNRRGRGNPSVFKPCILFLEVICVCVCVCVCYLQFFILLQLETVLELVHAHTHTHTHAAHTHTNSLVLAMYSCILKILPQLHFKILRESCISHHTVFNWKGGGSKTSLKLGGGGGG